MTEEERNKYAKHYNDWAKENELSDRINPDLFNWVVELSSNEKTKVFHPISWTVFPFANIEPSETNTLDNLG